jgi:uncharacterized membrane protein
MLNISKILSMLGVMIVLGGIYLKKQEWVYAKSVIWIGIISCLLSLIASSYVTKRGK